MEAKTKKTMKPTQWIALGSLVAGGVAAAIVGAVFQGTPGWVYLVVVIVVAAGLYEQILKLTALERIVDRDHKP